MHCLNRVELSIFSKKQKKIVVFSDPSARTPHAGETLRASRKLREFAVMAHRAIQQRFPLGGRKVTRERHQDVFKRDQLSAPNQSPVG